jgi:hypothetical protein
MVEAPLSGDPGNVRQADECATTALGIVQLLEELAITVQDPGGLEQLAVRQRTRVGEIARVVRVQAHDAREGERHTEHQYGEERQQQPQGGSF